MGVLNFGGLTWNIRSDYDPAKPVPYGPGPNYFGGTGATVDPQGRLHLLISKDAGGRWVCPEVITVNRLGFGKYSGVIESISVNGKQVAVTNLDNNAVLGIFGYPTADVGPDGTHEFDIELSYWGTQPQLDAKCLPTNNQNFIQFSTWMPVIPKGRGSQMWRGADFNSDFNMAAMNPLGFAIVRGEDFMEWKLWDTVTGAHWNHREEGFSKDQLSQAPMPFHLNLWLKDSKAPAGNVEVILKDFSFKAEE